MQMVQSISIRIETYNINLSQNGGSHRHRGFYCSIKSSAALARCGSTQPPISGRTQNGIWRDYFTLFHLPASTLFADIALNSLLQPQHWAKGTECRDDQG